MICTLVSGPVIRQAVRKITRVQKDTDKITWAYLGTKLSVDHHDLYGTLSLVSLFLRPTCVVGLDPYLGKGTETWFNQHRIMISSVISDCKGRRLSWNEAISLMCQDE